MHHIQSTVQPTLEVTIEDVFPYKMSEKLGTKPPHMINAYNALFIHFPPKKISDVKSTKISWPDKFFTFPVLSNQNLKQFTVCSIFSPIYKAEIMVSVHKLNLQGHLQRQTNETTWNSITSTCTFYTAWCNTMTSTVRYRL